MRAVVGVELTGRRMRGFIPTKLGESELLDLVKMVMRLCSLLRHGNYVDPIEFSNNYLVWFS